MMIAATTTITQTVNRPTLSMGLLVRARASRLTLALACRQFLDPVQKLLFRGIRLGAGCRATHDRRRTSGHRGGG